MSWRPMHSALLALAPLAAVASEGSGVDVLDMNLEQLRYIPVVTASRLAEPLDQAPGTIVVVTRQQIRDRGYLLLNLYGAVREVFRDADLFFRINDLTDRKYYNATHDGPPYNFDQSPQPRRSIMLGAAMRFSP